MVVLSFLQEDFKLTLHLVSAEQLAGSRRGGQLARRDLLAELRQQCLHTRLRTEILFQARIDALPHPRQGLVLASVGKTAIGRLQGLELSLIHI